MPTPNERLDKAKRPCYDKAKMDTIEILNLAGNLGVPAVILILVVWRGFPFLSSVIKTMQSRNGDLRDLTFAVRDLVEILKQRG